MFFSGLSSILKAREYFYVSDISNIFNLVNSRINSLDPPP